MTQMIVPAFRFSVNPALHLARLRSLAPAAVTVRHGVPPTYARGAYADDLRAVILACKERQGLGLVPVLAELVTGSALALLRDRWVGGPVLVVPVCDWRGGRWRGSAPARCVPAKYPCCSRRRWRPVSSRPSSWGVWPASS